MNWNLTRYVTNQAGRHYSYSYANTFRIHYCYCLIALFLLIYGDHGAQAREFSYRMYVYIMTSANLYVTERSILS